MLESPHIKTFLQGSISDLLAGYRCHRITPEAVIDHIVAESGAMVDNPIWISPPERASLQFYIDRLVDIEPDSLPLWGVPFAVKDNIDVAGMLTTAACPEYAYQPEASAFVVQCLIKAGAIPVGKTNLDQFATGLVGVRSPYGIPTNPSQPNNIPGGSSSGSAIALACSLVSFALGTDTAGSGRIPAAFNRLTGFKLSRGLLSTGGVVPACRSLDCVTLFTNSTADAALVANVAATFDSADPFARPNSPDNTFATYGQWQGPLRLAVIKSDQLTFFDDAAYSNAYHETINRLDQNGIELTPIDYEPFVAAAKQLYDGPWITERYIAIRDLLKKSPDATLPVTRAIIDAGKERYATEVYESIYQLADLRRQCLEALSGCDALLTPTAGKHFSLDELEADPIGPNQRLGHYTNYMNLLDMCGLAIPGLDTASQQPFGVTLVGDRFQDARLLAIGARLEQSLRPRTRHEQDVIPPFQDPADVYLAVCGAHMAGLPLNHQLTSRGAVLVESTESASKYRLYALAGGPPIRPGMIRVNDEGHAIKLEIWRMPAAAFASFVKLIPSPLGIGTVETASGARVLGFTCEQAGLIGAADITDFGGWRSFLASQSPPNLSSPEKAKGRKSNKYADGNPNDKR